MTKQESGWRPQDIRRVSLAREEDSLYWTSRFNVTRDELVEAIEVVGDDADAVAAYLNVNC